MLRACARQFVGMLSAFPVATMRKNFSADRVETVKLDEGRQQALRDLLDDSSPAVRKALLAHFTSLGPDAVNFLQSISHGHHRILARHAAWYLEELKFSDPVAEFRGFIRSLNYELETGALLLSRTVTPALDVGACFT